MTFCPASYNQHQDHDVVNFIHVASEVVLQPLHPDTLLQPCCFFCHETAPSSNSTLYKSPLHCRTEYLSLHASPVHIERLMSSRRTSHMVSFCWRSAAGRVKSIAKANIAMHTVPSAHFTTP